VSYINGTKYEILAKLTLSGCVIRAIGTYIAILLYEIHLNLLLSILKQTFSIHLMIQD